MTWRRFNREDVKTDVHPIRETPESYGGRRCRDCWAKNRRGTVVVVRRDSAVAHIADPWLPADDTRTVCGRYYTLRRLS